MKKAGSTEEAQSKQAKAIELNGASHFDVHTWSEYSEVNPVVNKIFEEIKNLRKSKNKRIREEDKVKKHLKVAILDLWVANKLSFNPNRGISKNKKDYQINSRYRKIHLTYDYLIPVINDLTELGYLEQNLGYQFHQTGKRTRIKATEKLINLILSPSYDLNAIVSKQGLASILCRSGEEETIILRDQDGNNIEYVDTDQTNKMRENLKLFNKKIARTRITLDISDEEFVKLEKQISSEKYPNPRKIDFSNTQLHRIFNNSSFELGGRFYGGWWQQIPRDYRKYIAIDYKHIAELDYSGLHIRILYAREGLEPPDDPYDIDGFDRDDLKTALLIILNAQDKNKAIKAINSEGIRQVKLLIAALESRHSPISKFFYSGEGLKLQYLDSMVAEQVMLTMLKHGATVLPVHDSFIVRASYDDELEVVMERIFEANFGKVAKIKPKLTSYEEYHIKRKEREERTGIVEEFHSTRLVDLYEEVGSRNRVREIWGY